MNGIQKAPYTLSKTSCQQVQICASLMTGCEMGLLFDQIMKDNDKEDITVTSDRSI